MMPAKSVSLAYAYKVGIRHAKGKRGNDKVGRRRRRGSTFKDWIVEHPFKVTVGSVGSVGGVLLAKKIIDHLCEKNKVESNGEIKFDGKVKLSKVDEEFIKRNFFLCAWENGSCWNDVFVQFFMCPDIRCKNYESMKIMKTIGAINEVLNQQHVGDCLGRKVWIPVDNRPVPDGYTYCSVKKGLWPSYLFNGSFDSKYLADLGLVNTTCLSRHPLDGELWEEPLVIGSLSEQNRILGYLGDLNNKSERYVLTVSKKEQLERQYRCDVSKYLSLSDNGYYPTYIIVHDDINYKKSTHVFSYYVIYDKNMEIKYFLKTDGLKKSMEVLPKGKVLGELDAYTDFFFVFSRSDIIEKYYIP